ncbi:hypothetical protein RSOLAG1IB_01096 [Rhizoctonia solani AG-1 IB]|uniref:Uncharacterized protein n=1 Tax=Thanatephorus cucumeris (strain AG1-IB / isolate 7/3/14) TaxID=1108050 RepID=A0A0B7FFY2_THACB|nr:hypothetical protein RSOLAG1IB_01096 [Rhizoctonia solani AG-1 IB]
MSPITSSKYDGIISMRLDSLGDGLATRKIRVPAGTQVLPLPLGSRFSGRLAGGATRDYIYGGSYYGSGYPYGSYGSTWVGGRPFPFYYWPIYIGPYEYYGSSEYGPPNSTDRPGGPMHTAMVIEASPNYNNSDAYRLLGDRDSVNIVLSALRKKCGAAGYAVFDYDPSVTDSAYSLPRIESIIQFYRASSFALSLDGYNNLAAAVTPAALHNNTGQLVASLLPPSPLPPHINHTFLACINQTVGTSLPLLDQQSINSSVTRSEITGSMIACMHLVLLILLATGLIKGVSGWLYSPREDRGTLLNRLADLVSPISAFSA